MTSKGCDLNKNRTILVMSCLMAVGCGAVSQLGVQPPPNNAAATFNGVTAIKISGEGQFVVQWEPPLDVGASRSSSYEVYLDSWTTLPTSLQVPGALVPVTGESVPLGVQLGHLPEVDSPVGKGSLLGTAKGGRSYTLSIKLEPPKIYGIQIRYLDATGIPDQNDIVLVYNPTLNVITFPGVTSLSSNAAGKVLINWAEIKSTDKLKAADLTYQVYMKTSNDPVATILAKGQVIASLAPEGDLDAGSHLAGTSAIGSRVDLPPELLPSNTGSLLGEVKSTGVFEVTQTLSEGLTYLFQVQVKGSLGQQGNNRRVGVYSPTKLTFSGIAEQNVSLSSDNSSINMSWSQATGSTGDVVYAIYSDGNFLAETTQLSYVFSGVIPGKTYKLSVKARDDSGYDSNTSTASIVVPIPTSYEGCKSGIAVSSTSIRVLFAFPSGASSVDIYRGETLVSSITSSATSYTDTGLTAGTSYTFKCNVTYGTSVIKGSASVTVTTNAS